MKFPNPFRPSPAPPAFGTGKKVPETTASWPSRLVFQWIVPLLDVGFSRPLEKDDLWELPDYLLTASITDRLDKNFYTRCEPEKRPRYMQEKLESLSRVSTSNSATREGDIDPEKLEPCWPKELSSDPSKQNKAPKYDSSLFWALHRTFIIRIWTAGALKLFSDTLKTTTPLVTKLLLAWLTQSYAYHRLSEEAKQTGVVDKPKGVGYGIGIAFAIFVMQESSSLMTNHYFQNSQGLGIFARTGLIGSIFRKSLRLSGRAKLDHSVGQITTMISTDASRLDRFSQFAHNLWVSPIQIIIGIGLLLGNLGYSALVGLGVLILAFPIQFGLVKVIFKQRMEGVKITDTRIRLTTEVLQGIRLIKFFGWESFYLEQISTLRGREILTIKKASVARSLLIAIVTFIPILAAILSFITYALSGHELNVAIIFSSLQLFNVIRQPLLFFPFVLSALTDALVALGRISDFLLAEELPEPYLVDQEMKYAIKVDGSFTWETAGKLEGKFNLAGKNGKQGEKKPASKSDAKGKGKKIETGHILPTTAPTPDEKDLAKEKEEEEKPFMLTDLKLNVPRGSFVAIVGRVGSGKSSVLQALVGEMRKTEGLITMGGRVAYAPQTPWIKNASLRDNVLFDQPDDEHRFREIISACSLEHDLEMLPNGEHTEIGEKGINISGGQKARVSLARAAYSPSEIVLLDDPLSAVDAYVGKAILDNCLLHGPLADRTRILVTHSLHVLDKTDYIYVMDNGVVAEEGTYDSLMKSSGLFCKLIEEYGSQDEERQEIQEQKADNASTDTAVAGKPDKKKAAAALMQLEERNTGAVTWAVYGKYFNYAGGIFLAPLSLLLLAATQGSSVGNNIFLGFWTARSINGFRQGDYIAVYAGLGVAQAIFTFLTAVTFLFVSLTASLRIFRAALRSVLRSPVFFFDTTPIGRILSRFSKDQDTLDQELATTLWQFLTTFSSVLGTVALVFYTLPYLGIIFAPMAVLYWLISIFYRRTSVETKRLDSLMRSALYGSYSETLTGLSTIRAYGSQNSAAAAANHGLDMENRAYYMTISIQRWLSVRLDLFGSVLVLGIALFAAGFRNSVDPSKIGVVLTYALSIAQVFSEMITQFATNEQNMNAVERILHYSELPSEAAVETPNDPSASWPEHGAISFKGVKMSYREGLPLVLKGVTFDVKPGEKIGVIGRTGAGKSSLLQALFRIVELQEGTISIDGQNISKMGLQVLRNRLALVPQDSTLFLGTLRENLDPQNLRTDAELIKVLQRAWLLPKDGSHDPVAEAKFSLDSTVGDEGSNYSAGEKQLLALCRALVKNSRIIVLDEATSSVDVETDSKIQQTIQTEFASSTLLCIAHRLNTIAYYDRILVMDQGQVAEFDTVLNLYDNETSIFRSLCQEANLQRADILRIRAEHDSLAKSPH